VQQTSEPKWYGPDETSEKASRFGFKFGPAVRF
jgi:hypothetical protein